MSYFRLNKNQKRVILTVTFGNILEWFDIYSYAYFAPIAAKVFFNFDTKITGLISAFTIFGAGFLTRPFGAIVFGRIGDLIGRKNAFILSIFVLIFPTFLIGCLPTYETVGIYAPVLLAFLRLMQSIPAAGEVPGAVCFLYEYADLKNRRYMASWAGVGNQIGAILAVTMTFITNYFMSDAFLMSWGWRIIFWFGGIIGLFGFLLRRKLQETPVFKKLEENHKIDTETMIEMINNHKNKIGLGTAYGVANAATFYLIATYIPVYFDEAIGLGTYGNIIVSMSILLLTTILIPFFGELGDRFNNKRILIACAFLMVILIYPFYYSVNTKNLMLMGVLGLFYIIPITCMTALLAYRIAHLFPPAVRFRGFGLAFNLSDGIVGGFTPVIALLLLQYTGNQAAFCWFILACSVISLASYFKIKE